MPYFSIPIILSLDSINGLIIMYKKAWNVEGGHDLYYRTTDRGLVWYEIDSTAKNLLNDGYNYYTYKNEIYRIDSDTTVYVSTDN